jgi:uncharacterized protein (TIGR00255 family)
LLPVAILAINEPGSALRVITNFHTPLFLDILLKITYLCYNVISCIMLKSMTGYGKTVCDLSNKKVTIELRSLNSRQLDLNTKIAHLYREKEHIIRNDISTLMERGKIDLSMYMESTGAEKTPLINKEVVRNYYSQLSTINEELAIASEDHFLEIILRLPETLRTATEELDEKEWNAVHEALRATIDKANEFRKQEGAVLEKDIRKRVTLIRETVGKVDEPEAKRLETIKARIRQNLSDFIPRDAVDQNRFEQELIYYIEKLDITEEKVRLKNHCQYFIQTIDKEEYPGRKLGFISQEMGREINTIGSKANDSDIQQLVVAMKDELEKIKEQLLNVL